MTDQAQLFYRPSPLRSELQRFELPPGLTIEQILPFVDMPEHLFPVVEVDGERIPPELWSEYRPREGALVGVLAAPHGGGGGGGGGTGKNILTAVAAIGIAVLSAGAGIAVAGALGFTAGTIGFGITAGLVGAGVAIAGNYVVNQLLQPGPSRSQVPGGAAEAIQPAFSITGIRNQAVPYGPIPMVIGKVRFYPPLAANYYTELQAGKQYLNALFSWYGPCEITSLRIGDTPIGDYTGVQYQIRERPSDPAITLYPRVVNELEVNALLVEDVWVERTSSPDTNVLTVDIVFPNGIWQNENGQVATHTVQYQIQYREVGTGTWIDWAPLGTSITKRTRSPVRWSTGRNPVGIGQYEVRVRRTSPSAYVAGGELSPMYWSVLRSIETADPIDRNDQCEIALRIEAGEQLNGVLDRFNCIAQTVGLEYSGGNWIPDSALDYPSDLFRYVLQFGPNPVPDSRIDLAGLAQWRAYCVTEGFFCNTVFDSEGTLWDRLKIIAAAGRATPDITMDGKWTVRIEDAAASVVQHFTPHNSYGFRMQRVYASVPHALRIQYFDRDNDFEATERFVYDDGYNEGNATNIADLDYREVGISSAGEVWKHGRFWLAAMRLRPETYTWNTDIESILCERGKHVYVSHESILVGLGSGRVKSVSGGQVTVSDTITMEAGKTYTIRFRLDDGTTLLRTIQTDPGDHQTVTLTVTPTGVAEGDLYSYGESNLETLRAVITAIRPFLTEAGALHASITAVPYNAAILNADQGAIPGFDPGISRPPNAARAPGPPTIIHFSFDKSLDGPAGTPAKVAITLVIRAASDKRPAAKYFQVDIRQQGDPWDDADRELFDATSPSQKLKPQIANRIYEVRARSLPAGTGPASAWSATKVVDTTQDAPSIVDVATVTSIQVEGGGLTFDTLDVTLVWTLSTEFGAGASDEFDETFSHYELRIIDPNTLAVVRTVNTRDARYTYTYELNERDGLRRTFNVEVRIVDIYLRKGPPGAAQISNPAPPVPSGLLIQATVFRILISFNLPVPSDWRGTLVHASTTSGYDPEVRPTDYDGSDLVVVVPVDAGEQLYVRVAHYDAFGRTDLNWSTEQLVGIPKLVSDQIADAAIQANNIANEAVTSTALGQSVLDLIQPIEIVSSLPTLPDANYPVGSYVHNLADGYLWVVDATGNAWERPETIAEILANQIVASMISAGAIQAYHMSANSVTTEALQAGSATIEKLAITNWENLWPNPIFATDATGTIDGSSPPKNLRLEGNVSDFAIRIDSTGGVGPAGQCIEWNRVAGVGTVCYLYPDIDAPYVECQPGDTYLVSAWGRNRGGSGHQFSLGVAFYQADGTYINTQQATFIPLSGTYEEFTHVVTAPAGATNGRCRISLWGGTAGDGFEGLITLITWRKQSGTLLLQDGAITADKCVAGMIQAGSAIIDTAAISSAQIIDLDAAKITANSIISNLIYVGAAQRMWLQGGGSFPHFRIRHHSLEQDTVYMGRFSSGHYGIAIYDSAGDVTFTSRSDGTTFMDGAIITNATITNAKIANLAVSNAKIEDEAATYSKFTSGNYTVGSTFPTATTLITITTPRYFGYYYHMISFDRVSADAYTYTLQYSVDGVNYSNVDEIFPRVGSTSKAGLHINQPFINFSAGATIWWRIRCLTDNNPQGVNDLKWVIQVLRK